MDLTKVMDAFTAYHAALGAVYSAESTREHMRKALERADMDLASRRTELEAVQNALVAALQGAGFVQVRGSEGARKPSASTVGRKNGRCESVLAVLRASDGLTKRQVLAAVADSPPGAWTAANVQTTLQVLARTGKVARPARYSRGVWAVRNGDMETAPAETPASETPAPGAAVPTVAPGARITLGRAALVTVGRLLVQPGLHPSHAVAALPLPGFSLAPAHRHRALMRALAQHLRRGRATSCAGGYRALPTMAAWLQGADIL